MKTDITYIVSHGFAVRMVLQTNLLGLLVEQGKKVALIAPDQEDENLKTYCSQKGVNLFEFNPESNFWTAQHHEMRKYFLDDIKKNPALWEKHVYASKFNKSTNPWNHIRPQLLILLFRLRKWFPSLKSWYIARENKQLDSALANELLETINSKILIATYPVNFLEAMLLKAAKKRGDRTSIHLLSWDNISCKGHFPQLADEYIVWGPIMKEELIEYYNVLENRIHMCGVPHFDLHIRNKKQPKPEIYLQELDLHPNRPYLFFGMSSPRFAPKEIDIVEWLASEVKKNTFGKELQLVIRPHPQNVQGGMSDQSWLPRLKALHGDRVGVDFPNLIESRMPWSMHQTDMERLSQLLVGCSVSLNSGSTLSIDALMCGVPVILTSFDGDSKLDYWRSSKRLIDYTHLNKLVNLGGVSVVHSFNEMSESIMSYVNNPDYKIKERQFTIEQQCLNYKFESTNKVIELLR